MKFLCFLQVSGLAYVSGARSIDLFLFDRSGATGFKCILASLLTVLRAVYTIVRPTSKDLP